MFFCFCFFFPSNFSVSIDSKELWPRPWCPECGRGHKVHCISSNWTVFHAVEKLRFYCWDLTNQNTPGLGFPLVLCMPTDTPVSLPWVVKDFLGKRKPLALGLNQATGRIFRVRWSTCIWLHVLKKHTNHSNNITTIGVIFYSTSWHTLMFINIFKKCLNAPGETDFYYIYITIH